MINFNIRKLQISNMRKLLIILTTLFFFTNLKAQHPEKIIIFLKTNFENNNPYPYYPGWLTDTINPWIIDEEDPENIWQVGKTYKAAFDTAYSVPNAIMTDTLNPYPINNHSSFEYLITKPEWAKDRCISSIILNFIHLYNTDTLKDGGYIDISYDRGETWANVIDDTKPTDLFTYFFYDQSDTLTENNRGFSGNSTNKWNESGISWQFNDETASEIDSVIIRFNIISDDIDNNKAGWIIDNIYFLIEDYCTIGINDVENEYRSFVYPNPVSDISILELPDNDFNYYVQMFNIQGKEVFSCISRNSIEINQNDFNSGIYFYKISNFKNHIFTGKFIVK